MTRFQLINFGCRASQADGAALKGQLLAAGLEESSPEQSHVVVLNTCTVTATADAEVRQVIRRIHRANAQCRIMVTGCYAQRAPQEIAQLPGVCWVVGNSHKHLVTELLKEGAKSAVWGPESSQTQAPTLVQLQKENGAPAGRPPAHGLSLTPDSELQTQGSPQVLVSEIGEQFHFAPVFPDDYTRPTLKVQDGCNARCSFCVIPQVRGPSRSLDPGKILEQVQSLEQRGYREIVLSGINLGCYGKDLNRCITFLGLLDLILGKSNIGRLRISSIEPMDVSPGLIRLVSGEPRMARHFHVPLQSGSDRILRLMHRRYWARHYAERIRAIHEQVPNCGIGADVMVGFPGETDLDHQTTLRFLESLPFTYLHVFPYSARPGTPAAALPGQLNGRLIQARAQEIRALMGLKRQAFLQAQIGRSLSVVTLDETHENMRMALSTNYLKVGVPFADLPPNTLLDIHVGRCTAGVLHGYPEPASTG